MMKKLSKIPSFIVNNNKALMITSLVAAFIIWFMLSQHYNPVSTRPISNVPINFDTSGTAVANLGLDVVNCDTETVSVEVYGKTAAVSSISASDIIITPSLSSVTEAGTYEVKLVASPSKLLSDFEIVSITPDKVNITFDEVVTRTFDVVAEAIGCTTTGNLVTEVPVMTESSTKTLNVSGAKSDVERIASVVARAEVNKELKKTTIFDADIILLDAQGNEIDSTFMNLGFEKANITVSVSMTKMLPVKPVFSGVPTGVNFKYSLSESKVTVIGNPEVVNKMESVSLREIECGHITKTNSSFEREVDLPSGVRLYDDSQNVIKVTVKTDTFSSKTLKVTKAEFSGLGSGLSAVLKSGQTVTLMGTSSEISSIKASDLTLKVDFAEDTTRGEYEKVAEVAISGNFKTVWVVTLDKTYNVMVSVS